MNILGILILIMFVGMATLMGIFVGIVAYSGWKVFGFGWWIAIPILTEVAVIFTVFDMLDVFLKLS